MATNEPERLVLLVSSDLIARARLADAVGRAGLRLETTRPGTLLDALRSAHPDVLVLDLDEGRAEVLAELGESRSRVPVPDRVIAYVSHVDEELRRAGRDAGCKVMARGQLWRALPAALVSE